MLLRSLPVKSTKGWYVTLFILLLHVPFLVDDVTETDCRPQFKITSLKVDSRVFATFKSVLFTQKSRNQVKI